MTVAGIRMTSVETTGNDPLAVGDRLLDRYVVTERLESGGTSVVYRAQDERLSRPVCIKVFHTLKQKEGVYRTSYEHFIQEAFALSKLTHPNILRIYDFGHLPGGASEPEGAPFQVSEFMSGGTLSSLIRAEGPLPGDECIRIVHALCGALGEAHGIGIVHRDIKPKNILFGSPDQKLVPKLADFGIAKALQDAQTKLMHRAGDTQVVAGRRLLMFSGLWAAPEQLAAEDVSRQSDLYSLALVTIYMLTAQSVFTVNDAVEAYKQRKESDRLVEVAIAGRNLPNAVIEMLKGALSFDEDSRPETAADFAREFADAFDVSDISQMEEVAPPRAESPIRPVPDPEPSSGPQAGSVPHPPQRLSVSDGPQRVGDRSAQFAPAPEGSADLTVANGKVKLRISFVPTRSGFATHVRGLNCFVKREGGRPTGAIELEHEGRVDLVANNLKPMATAQVSFGNPAAGHTVFPIGDRLIALRSEECPRVVSLDFGPQAECVFVYVPSKMRGRRLWTRRGA